MKRLRFAFVLAASIVPSIDAAALAAGRSPAGSRVFAGWTATCDNLGACVAIASSDDGDGLLYMRIARQAPAEAEPSLRVVFAEPDPIARPAERFHLGIEKGGGNVMLPALLAAKTEDDGSAFAATMPPGREALAMIDTIREADRLRISFGALGGRLSGKGLAAALRFIDDRQGRTGTPSALVARGMTPLGQVPRPPAPPEVRAAAIRSAVVATPPIGPAIIAMAKPACDPEVVEAHDEAAAWTLGPDRLLVAVPCTQSADNVTAALFTTDAKGESPRPAMLEQPIEEGDAAADNVVFNGIFAPDNLELSSLEKGRALGDCGAFRRWVWTGEIFALLDATDLEACPGALAQDWPTTYSAVRR